MKQLPLPIQQPPCYDESDFIECASNSICIEWLKNSPQWPERRLLITGPPGCGKTHLLHNWTRSCGAILLSGKNLAEWPAIDVSTKALAIDDADQAQDGPLLHWLNAAHEKQCFVLLSAQQAPKLWAGKLRDLSSRLFATHTIMLGNPEDLLLERLLMRLMSDCQMTLGARACEFLLARLPRSASALRDAVAWLDQAALSSGGKVTKPMLVQVVRILNEREGSSAAGLIIV